MRIIFLCIMTFIVETAVFSAPIIVKVGSVAPEGTPWALWLEKVAKRMEKDSNGELKIKTFFGGKLGGEKEIVEEVKRGGVQLYGGSVGSIASVYVPELNVFELPFLFDSNEEVNFVLDKMREPVRRLLEKRGFVMSMWSENGWHGLATKTKCIMTPADLKGMRMRSQESTIHLGTYKALGATPVELPVPEVLSALEVGVVDGFSTTPVFAFATGWYKSVKYYTYVKHIYQPALIVWSKKWFDAQPDTIKKVLLDRREELDGLKEVRALVQPVLDNFSSLNVKVCDFPSSNRKLFIARIKPVWDTFANKSKDSKTLLDAVFAAKKQFAEQKAKKIAIK